MSEGTSTTRARLITAMSELMRRQGYSATSVKQLTTAADATIGSLYHHFPEGKLGVAAAALQESGAAYIQLLPLLLDPHDDLAEAVTGAFDAAADQMQNAGWINLCPVGTVAGEIADIEPGLREVVAEVVTAWIDRGTEYFAARGLGSAAARELTLALLSALEGAFVLSRTLRSGEPLRSAGRAMASRATDMAAHGALVDTASDEGGRDYPSGTRTATRT